MDRRAFLAGLSLAAFTPGFAKAGMAKPYKLSLLIAEYDAATKSYVGGLDIRLDHGWKTYWRMPGDAGIPPQFDWSGSSNLKQVGVSWPAPHRFLDAGGETIGYKDRVVFPLRIEPANSEPPVKLDLALFFGVCQDICIPGNGTLSATSGQADPAAASLIAAYAAKVPRNVDANSPFRVMKAELGEAGGPALMLAMVGRGFESDFDVFVEGADFAYFRAPHWASEPSKAIVPFTTQGAPARLKGTKLMLTMVTPDVALEQDVTVE